MEFVSLGHPFVKAVQIKFIVMKTKSSKKKNLEKKRFLFFQVGMILALASVLAAFEWKTPADEGFDIPGRGDWLIIEESVPVTVHKIEKPLPVPAPANETILNIVADDQDDDDVVINTEDDDDVVNVDTSYFEPYVEPEPDDVNDIVFKVVEEMPEFVGGMPAMIEYLKKNIVYPDDAREAGITGKVFVNFVVYSDGNIGDVKVLRGIGSGCDEEAVRVISGMPKWKPGLQRGNPVNVEFMIPIVFNLIK